MSLGPTVPALPARAVPAATDFYVARLGFELLHTDGHFSVIRRDAARLHLWECADTSWQGRRDLADRPVRSGAESFLAGTASCRIETTEVDELYAELASADVLHPVSRGGPEDTDYGTREFHVLDLDGNLLTFYRWG